MPLACAAPLLSLRARLTWRPWPHAAAARPLAHKRLLVRARGAARGRPARAGRELAREAKLLRVACLALCALLLVATDKTRLPAIFCVADERSCDVTYFFPVMFEM